MFIEQLKSKNDSLIKYLPFALTFFLFMVYNYIVTATRDINANEMIEMLISKLGKNVAFALMVLPLSALCILLLLWVRFFHNQSITSLTTGRRKVDFKRIFFSFFLWASILSIITLVQYYISPKEYEVIFKLEPFITLVFLALILIPLQTSFEEYFFRGYLMQGLGLLTKNKWFPLIFTSVTFGLMHMANPEVEAFGIQMMVFYIGTGFFLGIITLMDDGLELALGFHAANNLIGAILVTSDNSALQTNAIFKQVGTSNSMNEIYLLVFVIFPILILFFTKKYKWKDWKNRLTGKV